ncbi:MAG TPA: hypothetical protein DDW52_11745, partial [Planctomycetaceae bacterium]|nr:hypothetical protein [Planctomycetaceae bacterium]
ENRVAPDVFSLFRFGGLLMGSGLAWACHERIQTLKKLRPSAIALAGGCAVVALPIQLTGRHLLSTTHTLWAVLWVAVLAAIVVSRRRDFTSKALEVTPLRWLGRYSYAMYVFQSPLIPLAEPWIGPARLTEWLGLFVGSLVYMLLMLSLTFALAVVSWHLFEKHFLGLKRYFPTSSCAKQ